MDPMGWMMSNFKQCMSEIQLWHSWSLRYFLKIGRNPKGNSSPNHHFSGAMLNFGGVCHIPVSEKPHSLPCQHLATLESIFSFEKWWMLSVIFGGGIFIVSILLKDTWIISYFCEQKSHQFDLWHVFLPPNSWVLPGEIRISPRKHHLGPFRMSHLKPNLDAPHLFFLEIIIETTWKFPVVSRNFWMDVIMIL